MILQSECHGSITMEKTHEGMWVISTTIGNERIKHKYMGYPKRESLRMFKRMVKERGLRLEE